MECDMLKKYTIKPKVFFFAVRGPLTVVASPVAEHRLRTHRLSGHGSRAQPLCGMWDLPRPGHEPVCPASAGRLSTTAPPGKAYYNLFKRVFDTLRGMICKKQKLRQRDHFK